MYSHLEQEQIAATQELNYLNMKEKLSRFYSSLPPWAKGLVFVFIAGVSITLFILARKAYIKAKNKANLNKLFKNDYNDAVAQGEKPSYPELTYVNLADTIEGATKGLVAGIGTDEEAIYDVFKKMNNNLDVILLEKAFGEREAADCIWGCPALRLGAFIIDDASASVIEEINTILSAKGITIKF